MTDSNARGTLLETLRLSRGLTQVELAELANVSQATLSKVEAGLLDLDSDRWRQVADALAVPVSAFENAREEVRPARVFHRKQKTTPKSAVKKIGADAALTQRRLGSLLGDDVASSTRLSVHDLEDGYVTPQEVAASVRNDLGLGTEPIENLTAVIESAGPLVLRWTLDSLQVDAIATWPENAQPVILIGDHVSAERQRFTMAHELGHAVMHATQGEEATDAQEEEANAFAAEFLLPRARLRDEWPDNPTVESLIPLKRRWGVSLAALIRRAAVTGLLDDRQYRDWTIRLATTGMHRREPEPIDAEQPRALSDAISAALARGATVDDLADRAHMYPTEFVAHFMEQ